MPAGKRQTILIAVVVALIIGAGALVYLSISRSANSAPSPRVVIEPDMPDLPAHPRATTGPVTNEEMEALGDRIVKGDREALAELKQIADELYRGINFQKDEQRVIANLKLMHVAFEKLGQAAASGNTEAMEALKISLRARHLSTFAPGALGTAAAAGNKEALDILVNNDRYGILQSSAVFAIRKPAEKNIPEAVDYLLKILADEKLQSLWHGAADGLRSAARAGNEDARAAVSKFDEWEASKRRR